MARYDMSDFEWSVIDAVLPRKSRGVPRVGDRRVLNGIFRVLRSGAPWADLPERYGPYTTCYNRFRRWTKAGIRDRIMDAVTAAHDGNVQMIDGTSVRVHHSAASGCARMSLGPGTKSRLTFSQVGSAWRAMKSAPYANDYELDRTE